MRVPAGVVDAHRGACGDLFGEEQVVLFERLVPAVADHDRHPERDVAGAQRYHHHRVHTELADRFRPCGVDGIPGFDRGIHSLVEFWLASGQAPGRGRGAWVPVGLSRPGDRLGDSGEHGGMGGTPQHHRVLRVHGGAVVRVVEQVDGDEVGEVFDHQLSHLLGRPLHVQRGPDPCADLIDHCQPAPGAHLLGDVQSEELDVVHLPGRIAQGRDRGRPDPPRVTITVLQAQRLAPVAGAAPEALADSRAEHTVGWSAYDLLRHVPEQEAGSCAPRRDQPLPVHGRDRHRRRHIIAAIVT
jgi:hypothetical protein